MTKDISLKVMKRIDDFADLSVGNLIKFPDGRMENVLNCSTDCVETATIHTSMRGNKYLQKKFYYQNKVDSRFKSSIVKEYKLDKNYHI